MPNRVEALRNRVALYRSYLRIGVRGDLAIQYMRQIADDLDVINAAQAGKTKIPGKTVGQDEARRGMQNAAFPSRGSTTALS